MKPSTYLPDPSIPPTENTRVPLCPVCKGELQAPLVNAVTVHCSRQIFIEPIDQGFRTFVYLY